MSHRPPSPSLFRPRHSLDQSVLEETNTFRGGYREDRGFNWFSGLFSGL